MLKTIEFLRSLPPHQNVENCSDSWKDLCRRALKIGVEDIERLSQAAQSAVGLPLLQHVQYDLSSSKNPSHLLGFIGIIPDAQYRRRTKQAMFEEIRELNGESQADRISKALEIEFGLCRAMNAVYYGSSTPEFVDCQILVSLKLCAGREYDAFREIYQNYRGIVGKLLELAKIKFCMGTVVREVKNVRGTKPLPKLDALFRVRNVRSDHLSFGLSFAWNTEFKSDEGVMAFRSLAILFTCIQKASAAPRSKKDHIVSYWNSLKAD